MTSIELSQFYAVAVAALCGTVIPALVDLVTKSHAPRAIKAGIGAVLSTVAGALATVNLAHGFHWPTLVLAVVTSFVTTMATHQTGVSNPVQRATANFGVGPEAPAEIPKAA